MGFLPSVHVRSQCSWKPCVAKTMRDLFKPRRGGAIKFSKCGALENARDDHVTHNMADQRTPGTCQPEHESFVSNCVDPIGIARRVVDHK